MSTPGASGTLGTPVGLFFYHGPPSRGRFPRGSAAGLPGRVLPCALELQGRAWALILQARA